MMTKQNDTAALTDEPLEGVAGGIIPQPSLRPVHIIVPDYIIDPAHRPRPPVGPCVTSGRASKERKR
jgi:hypothetical protein